MNIMERTIRFGVANNNKDRRSATWRCWTNLSGDNSVYVTCREHKTNIHLSFHDSGCWHVAFAKEKFDGLFEESSRPESRFANQWLKPQETAPGWVLACRICVPWYSITSSNFERSKNITWIKEPDIDQMCEIYIFLASPFTVCTSWPGAIKMKTTLVGSFDLADGSRVWIVSRNILLAEPELPSTTKLSFFKGVTKEFVLNDDSLRTIAWGTNDNGSVWLFEAPVKIKADQGGNH